jgi:hypothetical protein
MYTDPRDYQEYVPEEAYWQGGGTIDMSRIPVGVVVDFARPAHLQGETSFADNRATGEAETRIRALNRLIIEQHEPPLITGEVNILMNMILANRLTTDQQLVDAINASRKQFI